MYKIANAAVRSGYCLLYRYASTLAPASVHSVNEGQQIHGYVVKKVVDVPELFLSAVSLEHERTGAQHLHLSREDSNNTFGVAFRTTPMDSTGVPHILEHTVLCGSHRFPVRDPFFKMLNRSLATFMNAMTASDWTVYPFCTQNRQDFKNLLSVYLDAVFYPQLRELDFSQEGWRLEHTNAKDSKSPIIFKGVVFNEMKGVFSNSQNIYQQALENRLLPSHTYGVVSGGDPEDIPDLTWKKLKEFHTTHYHPSNARFFTYGNFSLEEHLEFIDRNYLRKFSKINPNTKVPLEKRWTKPQDHSVACRPDPMAPDPQKQTTFSTSYLLSRITDPMEAFTLGIIGSLLTDGETSPFYQSLLEANIGSDYAPATGYQGYTQEGSFTIGLQGIHENDVEKVRDIIEQTIDKVIEEGFDQRRIDALLHSIELAIKHQSSNFGLGLLMSIMSPWNHDGDPIDAISINKKLKRFQENLKTNPKFLQEKVRQYLKDNRHKLTLMMHPDEQYDEKLKEKEENRLSRLVSKLTDNERAQLFQRGLVLFETQMQKEDLSCLPTLTVDDIECKVLTENVDIHQASSGVPIYCSPQPTNEVTYVRFLANTSHLPAELKPYLPLFTDVLTKMGAGSWDYKELSQLTDLYTGGLGCSVHMSNHYSSTQSYEQALILGSHCLNKNLDKMLELWTEIISRPNFSDHNRLTTLIRMTASDLAASLAGNGHRYAMTHSASTLTPLAKWNEMFSGVTQVNMMKKLAKMEDVFEVIQKLELIANEILTIKNFRASINTSPDFMPVAVQKLDQFCKALPGKFCESNILTKEDFAPHSTQTHLQMPFTVNYVSKSVPGVHYTHQDYPSLCILARLMSAKFLHREIREKGGAYGSGAMNADGVFRFFSYRDPNSMKTLDVFDRVIEWAANGEYTDEDISEAKLSFFQQSDKPVPPGSRGMKFFLYELTDDVRQTNRDRTFATTRQALIDVVNKYLAQPGKATGVSFLGPASEKTDTDPAWNVLETE